MSFRPSLAPTALARLRTGLFAVGLALAVVVPSSAQTYNGNGGTGFGGTVGQGTLTISDNGTTLTGTISRGPSNFNDQLVIYIDSTAGGFGDTNSFGDSADGLRQSISGFNGTSRAALTFPAGFQADYALALGPMSDNFGGLWTLAAGGTNSLVFNADASLSPTGGASGSAASFTFSISLASIGVTPGASFRFVTTYLNGGVSYRSNESFGNSMPNGTDPNGNIGTSAATLTNFATYTTHTVPEPSTYALVAAGLAGLAWRRRRA